MSLWLQDAPSVELRPNFTESDLQVVIRAVYQQVFGNAHLLECDRLTSAESFLRDGDITVRGFVRMAAQSELYRSLFFDSSSQYRFIELNCKHFLGRAPLNQAEISTHVQIYNNSGYEAEIDSYIDSDEYLMAFGENIVPNPRGSSDPAIVSNVGFNRVYSLYRGYATSDSGKSAQLITDLAANLPTAITAPTQGGGTPGSNKKRFRVQATKASIGSLNRLSNLSYEVSYEQLNAKIKSLHRTGAKILSITEI
ncbi:MAG: phycobilisome rod-core linker polypeptide [Cyanobacteria bacterium J06621_8]